MVDGSLIQNHVDRGYAKAASLLGAVYQQYRASGPNNPMATPMDSLNAWITTDAALKGTTPMQFGKPQFYAALARENLAVGDYLVGPAGVFFVSCIEAPAPVALIYCNATLAVARAQDALPLGENAQRFGISMQNSMPFMTGWPASVLQLGSGSKMASTGMNLPTDAKLPSVAVLLPATAPAIRFNDMLSDDKKRCYMVAASEYSALGWRLTAELQPTG